MVTRLYHHLPRKDTTVCHLREGTAKITKEEAMRGMTGGTVGLPHGVDRGLDLQTCSSRIPIGMYSPPLPLT